MSVTSRCRSVGLSVNFFFFVSEFLSVSCLSVSCLSVSGCVTGQCPGSPLSPWTFYRRVI